MTQQHRGGGRLRGASAQMVLLSTAAVCDTEEVYRAHVHLENCLYLFDLFASHVHDLL